MASLGQDLKRERETRGISLKEISETTRIGLRYLEALEGDRLELIPQQFFLRAILRSYAKSVGLDEAQVLKKYDDLVQFGEQLEYQESGAKAPPAPRSGLPSWARPLFIGAGLLAAAALLYIFVLSPRRADVKPQATTRAPTAAAEVIPTPAPPAPKLQVPPAEQSRGLIFEATFSEETWLKVFADGRLAWQGIKRAGETLEVKATGELLLNCGNAGGLTFALNGARARSLGPRGAVVTEIRITPDNYRTFLLPEEAH